MIESKLLYERANEVLFDMIKENKCLSNIDINSYFSSVSNTDTIEAITKRLFSSLRNRNMMRDVINYADKKDIVDKILLNYDPYAILDKWNEETLFLEFNSHFKIKNSESKLNLWRQWSNSIISGTKFIIKHKNKENLVSFIDSYQKNEEDKIKLVLILTKEIKGMGFALACDFLKEIGYDYPKPDVHIIDIFTRLGLCKSEDAMEVYKTFIKCASECKVSAYKLDKILWLLSSGRFYLHELNVPSKKESFINSFNNYINVSEENNITIENKSDSNNNVKETLSVANNIDVKQITAKLIGCEFKNVSLIEKGKEIFIQGEVEQTENDKIIKKTYIYVKVDVLDETTSEIVASEYETIANNWEVFLGYSSFKIKIPYVEKDSRDKFIYNLYLSGSI